MKCDNADSSPIIQQINHGIERIVKYIKSKLSIGEDYSGNIRQCSINESRDCCSANSAQKISSDRFLEIMNLLCQMVFLISDFVNNGATIDILMEVSGDAII